MQAENKHILVGMAWPYANGSLHLGHLAGLLPADILARYHRLKHDDVLFVSGSDCHGTPISVKARQENIDPAEIAAKYHAEFKSCFESLGFSFDYYGQTTAPHHKELVQKIFLELYEKGLIYKKTEALTYCETCQEFLPDRYVEGTCPKCGYEHARGDQCDKCGALLNPEDLINPKCKTCGSTPIKKDSEHFFLKLSAFEKEIRTWLATQTTWRTNALNITKGFLEQGLRDRAITRDMTWGIEIPLEGYETKRIYVWFEAVCGYLTDSVEWAQQNKQNVDDWWDTKSPAWHYYVHGKDNVPFHSIIWPAILMGYDKHLPNQIVSSEYLTLENEKFATSRNWAVWVPDYLSRYEADPLRYYIIANGPETHDADFSWQQFVDRNNHELVGTYGNLVNRVLGFVDKNFAGSLETFEIDSEIKAKIEQTFKVSGELIEEAKLRQALQEIFQLAQFANKYIDEKAPWQVFKTDPKACQEILFQALNLIQNLAILLFPFVPYSSEKVFKTLSLDPKNLSWKYHKLQNIADLAKPEILFTKIDPTVIEEEKARLGIK
ncbi:MAG: methionine--tRNA ligase [Patescibacteria group bacterium]